MKCTVFSDDFESTVIKSEKFDCIESDPSDLAFTTSLCDIASSSLIKSPLIFELLISHGLLKNGHSEDRPLCDLNEESKVSKTS